MTTPLGPHSAQVDYLRAGTEAQWQAPAVRNLTALGLI